MKRVCSAVTAALLSLLAVFFGHAADAHRSNESYVYFVVSDTQLDGRFEAALADIGRALDIDADGDGEITKDEFTRASDEVFDFFAARLRLVHDGFEYPVESTRFEFLDVGLGPFAQMHFTVPGLRPVPEAIEVQYRMLFDGIDPTHLGFALIESNTRTGLEENEAQYSLIFKPGAERQILSLVGEPWGRIFWEFLALGFWRFLLQAEHIGFLVAILLPTAMTVQGGRWTPQARVGPALGHALKVVGTFMLANSLTLCLAALGILTLPKLFADAAVALSIAAAAFIAFAPSLYHRWFQVVFLFGLFHGFGLAKSFSTVGIDPTARIIALGSYNLGVELAILALSAVGFPVLFVLRNWKLLSVFSLRVGSVGLIALAALWFTERTFNLLGPVRSNLAALFG